MKRLRVLLLASALIASSFIAGVAGTVLTGAYLRVSDQTVRASPTVLYVARGLSITLPASSPTAFVSLGNVSVLGVSEVDLHVWDTSLSAGSANNFILYAFSAPDASFPGIGNAQDSPQDVAVIDGLHQGGGSITVYQSLTTGGFIRILPTGAHLRLWAFPESNGPTVVNGLTIALYLVP